MGDVSIPLIMTNITNIDFQQLLLILILTMHVCK